LYGGNVEITAVKEIYKASAGLHFVPEEQIIQLLTVIISQVVMERNVSVLFTGVPDDRPHDALLSLKNQRCLVFLIKCVFIDSLCQKSISS
jgi:hypothetical protein